MKGHYVCNLLSKGSVKNKCVCVCVCVCALTPVRLYLSRDREEEGGRGALVDLGEGYLKAGYATSHNFSLKENKV